MRYIQDDGFFLIILNVENTGDTPAIWYEVDGVSEVQMIGDGRMEAVSSVAAKPLRYSGIARSGSLTCAFSEEAMLDQFNHARAMPYYNFAIQGVVRYRTEFKETIEAPFAFFVTGRRP